MHLAPRLYCAASIIRRWKAAAEKMVSRLNLSGIHGFDLMLETQTNQAYLIEINPRATQVGHLTFGLWARSSGRASVCRNRTRSSPAPKVTRESHSRTFPARVVARSQQQVSGFSLSRCSLGGAGLVPSLCRQNTGAAEHSAFTEKLAAGFCGSGATP